MNQQKFSKIEIESQKDKKHDTNTGLSDKLSYFYFINTSISTNSRQILTKKGISNKNICAKCQATNKKRIFS